MISHRGNLNGPIPELENSPDYIKAARDLHFIVEVDLRVFGNTLMLGHDEPQYRVDERFIKMSALVVHCKNVDALKWCIRNKVNHFFAHVLDPVVLTSLNRIWTYPDSRIELNDHSIPVVLSTKNLIWSILHLKECHDVCTDEPIAMKKLLDDYK